MAISKIILNGVTQMDLTGDTVAADKMLSSYTAHKNDGTQVTGSISGMTLPSTSSATSSGTAKATITPTSSAQYLNIPEGYNDTAQFYTIAAASGGSSWTKVAETSYQVSTTSTSAATVATWGTGHSELWTSSKWVYVRVRDTAGKRAGYFYGSDNFFPNRMVVNNSGTSNAEGIRVILRYANTGYNTSRVTDTSGYGVYCDTVYNDGSLRIRSRYNANNSTTINGTYKVEVYLLDPPAGTTIFE